MTVNYLISRTSPRVHKTDAEPSPIVDGFRQAGTHRPQCAKRDLEFSKVFPADMLDKLTSKRCPKCFA